MSTEPAERLQRAWEAELDGRPGHFGLVLRSADGVVAAREADRPHYAASTVKLAVLGTVLSGAPDQASAAAPVRVHDRFASAAGGGFTLLRADDQDDATWAALGDEVGVADLADRMITVSSNIAMNLLAERVGIDAVQGFIDGAGLAGQVRTGRLIGDTAAEEAGITNTVSAGGLASLLTGLTDGSLLDPASTRKTLGMLARQQHRGMIPAGLSAGTWSASKGGWVPGVNHDVALVHPSSAPPYVLAVCTTHDLDHTDGQSLVARLSAITWEHWNRWHE